jgi:amidohydrolase
MPQVDSLRTRVRSEAERVFGRAYDLSHQIHAHPELGFEEHQASTWLAEDLAALGFEVERGVAGLPTALVAERGSGELTVAICAEYDALPVVGHACGHNVIAGAALVAAACLAEIADDIGVTVRVVGTPAEEGGGGKILLLDGGAFTGANVAMMVHPAPIEADRMRCQAAAHFRVRYEGRESHAAAAPELGINALDALTIAQVAIGLLRQHTRPEDRIHGIVTHGGDAPNIVPAHTEGHYLVRAATLGELATLRPRVEACFEAGALATGAALTIEDLSPTYAELVTDEELALLWRDEAARAGRVLDPTQAPMMASTDMGNVSLEVPTIHPTLDINTQGAVNHQPAFTQAARSADADRAMLEGGIAMALTAARAALAPESRARLLAHQCR